MDLREALAHDAEQQRQRILAYEPGPELDVLVATEVLGHRVTQEGKGLEWESSEEGWGMLRPYSSEVSVAWLVAEAFAAYTICRRAVGVPYRVTLFIPSGVEDAYGDTLPLAVCRAALLAVLP